MRSFLTEQVDVDGTTRSTLDRVADAGIRIVIFVVILMTGWFLARALHRLAERLLDRVGFSAQAERTGIRRWSGTNQPAKLLAKIIYYALLLITLQLALIAFGPNPVSGMLATIVALLPRLFVALVILLAAVAIGNAVFDLVGGALRVLDYGQLLARAGQLTIIGLGVLAALDHVGVATSVTTPVLIAVLATGGGILIVGVGGGLVGPMASRWERILGRAEREGVRAAARMRDGTAERGAADPEDAAPEPPSGRAAQATKEEPASEPATNEAVTHEAAAEEAAAYET